MCFRCWASCLGVCFSVRVCVSVCVLVDVCVYVYASYMTRTFPSCAYVSFMCVRVFHVRTRPSPRWSRGATLAGGQNLARSLMETPANILTPTQFAQVSLALRSVLLPSHLPSLSIWYIILLIWDIILIWDTILIWDIILT